MALYNNGRRAGGEGRAAAPQRYLGVPARWPWVDLIANSVSQYFKGIPSTKYFYFKYSPPVFEHESPH